MIVGIPSNDFGSQEPGEATEIADTASRQYSVTFPMASKTVLKAADARPSYKRALQVRPKEVPRWNFRKHPIGRDRYIAEVFPETVEPSDTRIKTAIARAKAQT